MKRLNISSEKFRVIAETILVLSSVFSIVLAFQASATAIRAYKIAEEANLVALEDSGAQVNIYPVDRLWWLIIGNCTLPASNEKVPYLEIQNRLIIANTGESANSIEKIDIQFRIDEYTLISGPTKITISTTWGPRTEVNLPISLAPGQTLNVELRAQSIFSALTPTLSPPTPSGEIDRILITVYLTGNEVIQLSQQSVRWVDYEYLPVCQVQQK